MQILNEMQVWDGAWGLHFSQELAVVLACGSPFKYEGSEEGKAALKKAELAGKRKRKEKKNIFQSVLVKAD